MNKELLSYASTIHEQAVHSLFQLLESICEGAVVVDRDARIVWISEKYLTLLGLGGAAEALGKPIEEVIPASLMRHVVETGEPILLDIMEVKSQSFVVTRLPLKDERGGVTGAVGFVLYDRPQYLNPLVSKFARLQSELAAAQRALAEHRRPKYTFSSFVGASPACPEVKRQARRAAQLDTTVLLQGETGTGKELLAHAIHAVSTRSDRPLIGVNLAAIPENLLEAEFFGVAPGAYTGAERRGRDGKLKLADGGTLFLDEVGDMPMLLQAKLLRVLQEQEFEPLGSNKVIKVDVRVIAATSRDLKLLVQEGKFRADLYYRLNVLKINVPPLRDRLPDLDALCEVMLERIAERTGLPQREFSAEALAVLSAYSWPGNVRELRNVLEQVTMLAESPRILGRDFASILPEATVQSQQEQGGPALDPPRRLTDAVAEAERSAIQAALLAADGNKATAARILGISRATLYEKMTHLGLGPARSFGV
ncbi:MAG: sigma 54-interacting transcriptional regulator [Betaproteobacteria bacterium]|nr:sigma 54-interacting transcriptional regulator [Betaproteobacteria bacterium]